MAGTIVSTARGTNNILSNKVVINMSDKISMLRPSASPLTVLLRRIASQGTTNYKFEWMEDDIMARWVTFTPANEETPGTTLTLDVTNILAVDDLLKNPRTGEVMRVTEISSDTAIKVTRGYGETEAAVINKDDKLLCVGNAIMQGDGAPGEKYSLETPQYNYTQIFKTPFSITNTLNATKLYGGKELDKLRFKKGIEHNLSLEYAFLFGERKLDVTGGQPRTTTAGVIKFLAGTDNVKTVARSSVAETDVDAWAEKLFTYGSTSRILLCSPSWISLFSAWAKANNKVVVEVGAKKYGLSIYQYMTPHGDFMLVKHPLLVNGYDNYAIALDMEELKYRALTGRDTKLETNIQGNDEDGVREQYITEAGLELRQPKVHGMFILS